MSIENLIDKLAQEEQDFLKQKIFSPHKKGVSKILVRINGIIYKFNTPKFRTDGFGVFKAVDAHKARKIRPAELFERDAYLQLLPKVDFILVYKMDRWLAYPANINSFKQRFGEPNLFPILTVDNVEVMDTIEARFDGVHFWFDCAKFDDIENIEKMRERIEGRMYNIPKINGITPEQKTAFRYASGFHKEANKSQLEQRLEREFGMTGAQMEKFIERGGNVEVQWKDGRRKYTSVLNKEDLSVVTAGICLSGGDKLFDLQSLVTVCRQGAQRGRIVHVGAGGMDDDAYWDMYGRR